MAVEVGTTAGSTRGDLRRAIGGLTGDFLLLTATATGTATTFIDDLNLSISNNSIMNRILWVVSGHDDNVGKKRRVTANSRTDTSITFAALPQATDEGDVIELWSSQGQGITPDEVNRHINMAISMAADAATVLDVGASSTFDYTSPTVALPDDIVYATGAQWQGQDSIWYDVPPADLEIDAANRTFRIKNQPRELASGRPVRARGAVRAGQLTADDKETGVPYDWLIHQAASTVLLAASTRVNDHRRDDYKSRSQYCKGIADTLRPVTAARAHGGHNVRV